jgi:hypothetical protein
MDKVTTVAYSEWPSFTDLSLDPSERTLIFQAISPPHTSLPCTFETDAFDTDLSFGKQDSEGNVEVSFTPKIDMGLVAEAAKAWSDLAAHWDILWPKVYESILATRHDYGREDEVGLNQPRLEISPPGVLDEIESDNWTITFTMPEFDGYYYVDFELDGRIVDSGADF